MCWYRQNTGKCTDDPHDLDTRLKLSPQRSSLYCCNQHLVRHTAEKNNLQVLNWRIWASFPLRYHIRFPFEKALRTKLKFLEFFISMSAKTGSNYHKINSSNTKTGTCLCTHFLLGVSGLNGESKSMWLAWPDMPLKLEGVLTFAPGLQT